MVKQERDKQKADLNNLKVVNEELKEEIIKLQNKVKEQSKIEANESLKLDFEKKKLQEKSKQIDKVLEENDHLLEIVDSKDIEIETLKKELKDHQKTKDALETANIRIKENDEQILKAKSEFTDKIRVIVTDAESKIKSLQKEKLMSNAIEKKFEEMKEKNKEYEKKNYGIGKKFECCDGKKRN